MSEHYIGRPVSSEEIGLNRPSRKTPVVEQETQYHRTSERTRESLRRQPAFELSEEDQRSLAMTDEEVFEQRISFAYGNVSMHNPSITKEMVREQAEKLYGKPTK